MAIDIAQRPLDMNGFRIAGIADPTTPGDATKTDNHTFPLPSAGAGAPGASLLAAPIDHVHPAAPGTSAAAFIRLADSTLQQVSTDGIQSEVLWDDVVDFDLLPGTAFNVTMSADVKRLPGTDHGTLELRLDGDPASAGVGEVLSTIVFQDDDFTRRDATLSTPHAKPAGRHRITVTGVATFQVREKELIFVGSQ